MPSWPLWLCRDPPQQPGAACILASGLTAQGETSTQHPGVPAHPLVGCYPSSWVDGLAECREQHGYACSYSAHVSQEDGCKQGKALLEGWALITQASR